MMPASLRPGNSLSFIDALFTTASAIAGAGLAVKDTGTYFSFTGQAVLFLLIEVGNIGYMIFFALAVLLFGKKLSIVDKMIIKESISPAQLDLVVFVKLVFKYALVIQAVAALLLTGYWLRFFPLLEALRHGVFHAGAAFCTAGFSLFPNSFTDYRHSWFLNLVVMLTACLGAIGFFVLYDLHQLAKARLKGKEIYRLSTHTRLVLSVATCLMLGGTCYLYLSENWLQPVGYHEGLLESLFQAVSCSTTAGFNTTDIAQYNNSSLLLMIMLMFIGASPSGTGGGIKTTVFAVMLFSLYTLITNRGHISFFSRSVSPKVVARASSIGLLAFGWVFLSLLILTVTEPGLRFMDLAYETVSAAGCVGMSTGITASLSSAGKLVLTFTLLIGRIGPLLIGYSLLGRSKARGFEYPEGSVLIV